MLGTISLLSALIATSLGVGLIFALGDLKGLQYQVSFCCVRAVPGLLATTRHQELDVETSYLVCNRTCAAAGEKPFDLERIVQDA